MNTSQTASTYLNEEQFDARLLVGDSYVHIVAKTLADLTKTVAQLRPTEAVGKTAPATKTEPKKEAAAQTPKQETASTSAAAATPAASPAASPATAATPAADEPTRPTYDDVKRAVLALAKISSDTAKATLAKFTGQNGQPCDHGTKLKLEDYPAFLAAADEQLKVAA